MIIEIINNKNLLFSTIPINIRRIKNKYKSSMNFESACIQSFQFVSKFLLQEFQEEFLVFRSYQQYALTQLHSDVQVLVLTND